jgi:CDP-6-deoxy-D-xylo-4-hexulose-3-dehydrase
MKNVNYRVVGDLSNTDTVMNNTFWVGVFPGLQEEQLEFIAQTIKEFCGV